MLRPEYSLLPLLVLTSTFGGSIVYYLFDNFKISQIDSSFSISSKIIRNCNRNKSCHGVYCCRYIPWQIFCIYLEQETYSNWQRKGKRDARVCGNLTLHSIPRSLQIHYLMWNRTKRPQKCCSSRGAAVFASLTWDHHHQTDHLRPSDSVGGTRYRRRPADSRNQLSQEAPGVVLDRRRSQVENLHTTVQ